MKRSTLNLIIDVLAGAALLGMIVTGYLLWLVLPPGTNRSHILWGHTRHFWGEVHTWTSAALLALLAAHVVLHWRWIAGAIASRVNRGGTSRHPTRAGVVTLLIMAAGLAGVATAAHRAVEPRVPAAHEPARSAETPPTSVAWTEPGAMPAPVDPWAPVAAIMAARCTSCHGPDDAAGGVRCDTWSGLVCGPQVWAVPGAQEKSPLLEIIDGRRTDIAMPGRHRLPDQDVTVIRAWIDAGTPGPRAPATRSDP